MSTSREARESILRRRIRELIDENKVFRRKIHELERKEMTLRDRVLRNVRKTFEEVLDSPTSPPKLDATTQTEPVSGSDGGAPAPSPNAPTPGGSCTNPA